MHANGESDEKLPEGWRCPEMPTMANLVKIKWGYKRCSLQSGEGDENGESDKNGESGKNAPWV